MSAAKLLCAKCGQPVVLKDAPGLNWHPVETETQGRVIVVYHFWCYYERPEPAGVDESARDTAHR